MSARFKSGSLVSVRRSTSEQEIGGHEQLKWAIAEVGRLGVQLHAQPWGLDRMLEWGLSRHRSIYPDHGVSGADLHRRGLTALRDDALVNRSVNHLLLHMSDRFARPGVPAEAMMLAAVLLDGGLTLVFSHRIVRPGERSETDVAADGAQLVGIQLKRGAAPGSGRGPSGGRPRAGRRGGVAAPDVIAKIMSDPSARAEIPDVLKALNVNLWLRFGEPPTTGMRATCVVESGILTIGTGVTPVPALLDGKGTRGPPSEVNATGRAVGSQSVHTARQTGDPSVRLADLVNPARRNRTTAACDRPDRRPTWQ